MNEEKHFLFPVFGLPETEELMSNANAATSTFVPLQEQNLTNRFLFDEVVEDKSTGCLTGAG